MRNYKGCTNPFRTAKLVVRILRGYAKTKSQRLFKPLQTLFPFCTPYPPFAKSSVTLRRPNSHSLHLPLEQFEETPHAHTSEDSTTTPLWSIDLSYSLNFLHGADKRNPYRLFIDSQSEAKSLLSEGFDISGPRGLDHSTF